MQQQVVEPRRGKREGVVRIISDDINHELLEPFLRYFSDVNLSKPFYPTHLSNYELLYPKHWQEEFENFGISKGKIWKVVGTVKAHIRACANILQHASKYGIIIEEDCKPNPNLSLDNSIQEIPRYIEILESVDSDWGAILLGWCAWKFNPVEKSSRKFGMQILRVENNTNYQDVDCMHAYAISMKGAKAYIEWHQGFRPSDEYLNDLNRLGLLRLYYLKIPTFVQPWQLSKACDKTTEWYPHDFGGHCEETKNAAESESKRIPSPIRLRRKSWGTQWKNISLKF